MAISYLSNIDLRQNEIQNVVVHNQSNAPSNPKEGQIYFNTDASFKRMYVYDGTDWLDLTGDIRSITAGAGLTGTSFNGDVTLDIGQGNGITVNADNIQLNTDPVFFKFTSQVLQITTDAIGPTELAPTTVTAGSYGSATQIPTFTVDEDGRLTAAGTAEISTTLTVDADGPTTADVDLRTDDLQILGTANEIETTVSKTGTDVTVQVGLPNAVSITDNLVVSDLLLVNSVATPRNVHVYNGIFQVSDTNGTLLYVDTGSVTIGTSSFGANLRIYGNLTVEGTTTTVNSETVLIADNIITLNSNVTGTPSENAGVEVERGTSTNVSVVWNETSDRWTFTNDGSTYHPIPITGDYNNYSFSITDGTITEAINSGDVVTFAAGAGIDVAVSATDTVTYSHADTSSVTDVDNSGLTVVQDITFDGFGHVQTVTSHNLTNDIVPIITGREYATTIGDGTNTGYTIDHGLGSYDVIVQLYEISSGATVYADVSRIDNAGQPSVYVSFSVAPSANSIRVLIKKIG